MATLLLCTSLGACTRQNDSKVVKIGYLPITACLPDFVGDKMGYFQRDGIKAEFVRFDTSQLMMDALIQGKIDALSSVASAVGLIIQEKKPDQLRVFALNTNGSENPLDVLLVQKGSPIHSVQELKGKRIGSFPGIQAVTLLKKYLRTNGLDPDKDVQIQEIKQELHLQALAAGQIDAVLTYEPNATVGKSKDIARILVAAPFATVSVNPYPTGMFAVSRTFAEANPSVMQQLVHAFTDAMNYTNDHQAEARKLLPTFTAIEEETAARVPLSHFEATQSIDTHSLQQFADVLYAEGVLKGKPQVTSLLLK